MTTRAGAGSSNHPDSFLAGSIAAKQAIASFQAEHPSLMFLFTTDRYDQEQVLAGVRSVHADSALIGCCTGGVISAAGPSTDSVAILAIQSPHLSITSAATSGIATTPEETAERAAEQLEDHLPTAYDNHRSAVFAFADGLSGRIADAVQSAAMVTGPLCPLIGGGAGDNLRFAKTSQFLNEHVYSDAIALSLVKSDRPIGIGVRHGWSPKSRALVVTKSIANIVYEFDGEPAFQVYCELFPDAKLSPETFGEFVMSHPIGIPQASDEFLIRDPLRVLPDGAIEFIASVPEHAVAHIMEGDRTTLFRAAQEAAHIAIQALDGAVPQGVLVFDCVSRLLMLGSDASIEVEKIRAVIGTETPLAGMFSFGEIAPGQNSGIALHNKTVVVCAFA